MGGGVPWYERQEARQIASPGGLINSAVPGRTDQLPMTVPGHSYVIPADVVSGIGQGNTIAGAKIWNHLLKMGPYFSEPTTGAPHGHTMPTPYHMALQPWQTSGGVVGHQGGYTDVIVAGGELLVVPAAIHRLGMLEMRARRKQPKSYEQIMKCGHEVLDRAVTKVRAQVVAHTKKLPGPKK